MIHPAWGEMLARLRDLMDARGLGHVRIVEETDGTPLTPEELERRQLAEFGRTSVALDEYVTFEPVDPRWRVYRVEGIPREEGLGEAELRDFQSTPSLSLSADGRWEMAFAYDQGSLPPETFEDATELLETLLDHLTMLFGDPVFTLRVRETEGPRRRRVVSWRVGRNVRGGEMPAEFILVNRTKRETVRFTHVPASKPKEIAGHPAAAAIVAWYLLHNPADRIGFVSTTECDVDWPDRTDDVVSELIEAGILRDGGVLYRDEDDPAAFLRDLRNVWME